MHTETVTVNDTLPVTDLQEHPDLAMWDCLLNVIHAEHNPTFAEMLKLTSLIERNRKFAHCECDPEMLEALGVKLTPQRQQDLEMRHYLHQLSEKQRDECFKQATNLRHQALNAKPARH